jgi:hypothetical protein
MKMIWKINHIRFKVVKQNRVIRMLISCRPLWISRDSEVFFSLPWDKEHRVGFLNHACVAGSIFVSINPQNRLVKALIACRLGCHRNDSVI